MKNNQRYIKLIYSTSPVTNLKGFTIVEVMIAVLILFIIVFAFTPLLVGSMQRISYAGDKSEAIAQSQAALESDISYRETVDGDEVTFTFGEVGDQTVITVPGGFIDSPRTEGRASAWLKTFIPYVPFITLSSPFLTEGYNGDGSTSYLLTHIMGIDTKLLLSNPKDIKIYTRDTFDAGGSSAHNLPFTHLGSTPPTDLPDTYDEYIEFNLPARASGLTNTHSPYVVEMNWLVDSVTVTVRARLHITLPEAVVVGNSGTIIVSPDANDIWNSRNNAATMAFDINDIIWSDFRYLAVTSAGKVLRWGNQEEPTLIDTPVGTALNSLASGQGKIVAVGDSGVILFSDNGGQTWVPTALGSDGLKLTFNDLRSVSYSNDAQEFIAVGPAGTVLRSADANLWVLSSSVTGYETLNFAGSTYHNGSWYIAGAGRVSGAGVVRSLIFRENASDPVNPWSLVYDGGLNHTRLNDISCDVIDEVGTIRYVAVGNNGQIVTSSDGTSWTLSTYGSGEFRSIIWDSFHEIKQYILVGNNGLLVTGTPNNWVTNTTGSYPNLNLKGVTIRWEN